MKCLVCLTFVQKMTSPFEDNTHGIENVDKQLEVIFLLRKVLKIPKSMCSKFLQDYGHPRLWVHCCTSCLSMIEKARKVFEDILLLQKQFRKFQLEFKEEIVKSVKSGGVGDFNELEPEPEVHKIVHSYIMDACENTVSDGSFVAPIKIEEDAIENFCQITEYDSTELTFVDASFSSVEQITQSDSPGDILNAHSDENDVIIPEKAQSKVREKRKSGQKQATKNCKTKGKTKCTNGAGTKPRLKVKQELEILTKAEILDDIETSCEDVKVKVMKKRSRTINKAVKSEENRMADKKPSLTSQGVYICEFCEKSFKHHCHFKAHMYIHTGEKPYVCDICGKTFNHPSNLKTHLTIHNGIVKNIKCDICEKLFGRLSKLRAHMRTHTDERPFPCTFCGKGFKFPKDLKIHERIHTGEKPYACNICNRPFTQLGAFRTHERTHTRDKSLKCNICGEKFEGKSSLYDHKERVHLDKLLLCDLCPMKFATSVRLKKHQSTHQVKEGQNFPEDMESLFPVNISNNDEDTICEIVDEDAIAIFIYE